MTDDDFEVEARPVSGIGEQLRAAREARGLSLAQVAAETRIPQRQLVSIEAGDWARLPGRTYAVGFSRTYARLLGLDPGAVVENVRAELDANDPDPRHRAASFEPGDPARVPSRLLGWLSAVAVILVLAGLFVFARTFFAPAGQLPSLVDEQQQQQRATQSNAGGRPAGPAPSPVTGGAVVFTAIEDGVWVKFYDGSGKQLMQKNLAKGESYTVPADAQNPKLWTGRPEALAITVGGRPIAKLSETQKTMKDVPVTPAALIARNAPAPASSPVTRAPSPTPTA